MVKPILEVVAVPDFVVNFVVISDVNSNFGFDYCWNSCYSLAILPQDWVWDYIWVFSIHDLPQNDVYHEQR